MDQSIGRASEPTTEAGAPDASALDPQPDLHVAPDAQPDLDAQSDPVVRSRVRDVPPPVGYDALAFTDPEATGPIVDPLDPHKPGLGSGDPLDPDSHLI